LRAEKDDLIKNCTFRKDIQAKGVKRMKAYFEDHHVIISGKYFCYKLLNERSENTRKKCLFDSNLKSY